MLYRMSRFQKEKVEAEQKMLAESLKQEQELQESIKESEMVILQLQVRNLERFYFVLRINCMVNWLL